MAHESLADKAAAVIATIGEIEQMLVGINDYGDPTGYCKEHENILEDAHSCLGSLRRRALTLKRRFELNNKKD